MLIREDCSATCVEMAYLLILHRSRVEMRCKLRKKFHRLKWILECEEYNHFTSRVTVDGREFKMLPRLRSNKIIQINASKKTLSFIINRVCNTMSNRKEMKI